MMHRSYQPILPAGSRFLQREWDRAHYNEHRRKVQSAKPIIHTQSPATYPHLHLRLKKLKLQDDRLSTIERDNQLLLSKIAGIMRTTGRVDNKNEYISKSLNRTKHQKELLRVSRENKAILERIRHCEPQYNHLKWHEERHEAEKYMDNIARYPRGYSSVENTKSKTKRSRTALAKEPNKDTTREKNGPE